MPCRTLADLPLDIHSNILGFLHPTDIIATGQSCKSLHFVCSMRSIWIGALRSTISTNFIFGPFHAPNLMTLDELQHAATAPARMVRLLEGRQRKKNYENRKIHCLYSTVVPLYRTDECDGDFELDIQKIFLVPGGRYVVATSSARLMVIDLKRFFNSSGDDPAEYVVSLQFRPNSNDIKVGQAPDKPSNLRIVVPEVRNNSLMYSVTVFEYDSSTHELSILRRFLLPSDLGERRLVSCLVNNLFVFVARQVSIVYVWDFVRDLYVSWKFDAEGRISNVMVSANKVILLSKHSVDIWNMPPLFAPKHEVMHSTPTPSSSIANVVSITDISHIAYESSDTLLDDTGNSLFSIHAVDTSDIRCIDGWYTGAGHPPIFDIFLYQRAHLWKDVAFRHHLCFPGHADISTFPGDLEGQPPHLQLFDFYPFMDSEQMTFQPYRSVDRLIVMHWYYRGVYYLLSTSSPGPEALSLPRQNPPAAPLGADLNPNSHLLYTDSSKIFELPITPVRIAHGTTRAFCFDPPSGRLCRPARDGRSLVIQDFLPLPPSLEEKYYATQREFVGNRLSWEAREAKMRQWMKERKKSVLVEDVSDDETFYDQLPEEDHESDSDY
ncbi:hypothetical protein GALMADRAFT_161465 [Galerina marginata CBS 339.88]|uniref:F-box domain-containing protein n=1 Tax=Galerina marginata (strain CBS 339.88) TaxID=685588 RepID=A0A067S9Z5_GALM3|nr:hypothetical protein GALMADRAFT_161465 [Galerina marginata CBS 339.88]